MIVSVIINYFCLTKILLLKHCLERYFVYDEKYESTEKINLKK